MAAHSLIAQVDGPFLNAGIFYVQHVEYGDATAWALEELNRRIGRLTYHPESVAQLPHSRSQPRWHGQGAAPRGLHGAMGNNGIELHSLMSVSQMLPL